MLKIVGFFADETDAVGFRETVLDRMLDQGVLCNQKRRDQQESRGFQRSFSRQAEQSLGLSFKESEGQY
ncbi:MAG: hypothetical protein ACRERU_00775 [Methylococcales bacterium]